MARRRRSRIALAVALALVVLVIVLVARASALRSRQPTVAPLAEGASTGVDGEAIAKHLGAAIRRKTVSTSLDVPAPDAELEALHADLATAFPKAHAALTRETIGEKSLLFTWKGRRGGVARAGDAPAPVILCAHMDVVPVEAGTEAAWTHPPFDGVVEGGFVWGRGALDDKGSLVTILAAVESLVAEGFTPDRTVYLAFGDDEEITGRRGAAKIAEALASRGVHAEMALDEGAAVVVGVVKEVPVPVAAVGIAEKGYVSVDLKVEVPGGHSSMPGKENALTVLARAVARVHESPMPARIDGATAEFFAWAAPEMPFGLRVALANRWLTDPLLVRMLAESPVMGASIRTTTAPTVFHAGVKDNVVPASATATINFRVLPGDTTADVIEHVKRAVRDDRVVVVAQAGSRTEPSPVSRSSSRAFGLLAETIREVLPGVVVAPSLVLGATDGRAYVRVADDVYRFLPFPLTSSDIASIHGKNERVSVPSLATATRFYRRLLTRL